MVARTLTTASFCCLPLPHSLRCPLLLLGCKRRRMSTAARSSDSCVQDGPLLQDTFFMLHAVVSVDHHCVLSLHELLQALYSMWSIFQPFSRNFMMTGQVTIMHHKDVLLVSHSPGGSDLKLNVLSQLYICTGMTTSREGKRRSFQPFPLLVWERDYILTFRDLADWEWRSAWRSRR